MTSNDDLMQKTMLIIEHKIRNLEKRKLKLEGYLQQQEEGVQLSDDQLLAASKFSEVVSTLDFARNLKDQLNTLLITAKQIRNSTNGEKLPTKVDSKIKQVLNFQNILESIKDDSVKQDLLAGNNGAVQLTDDELSKLSHFSKMVSPKRRVEEGKPLFEDQLKTVSKHYMKLIDSKPNIVAGTSYAHLKECLLKIEKSGYLNNIVKLKHLDKEVNTINEDNSLGSNIFQNVHQPTVSISNDSPDNIPISSIPNVEFTPNKIETIYFTNNNIGGNTVEQNLQKSRNTTDSVFNTSFDFLQDSQLEEDIISVGLNSIPTQTFSSSIYGSHGPTDDAILKILSSPPQHQQLETKQNHLENVVNVNISNSNSWTGKPEVNWQNRTESGDSNNLPRENWSMAQMINNSTNNDWLTKNNWVQMAEVDKQNQAPAQPTQPSPKNSSSNFGLVTNGYTENLDELLQKSVVFNKQESYPVTTSSNNSTYYQTNYGQQLLEHNIGHYTNSNGSNPRSHSNDYNKRSTSMKPKASYTGEGGPSRGYQQGNSYVYNNRSYKSNTNTSNEYSRISRQT
ncbi:caprin-2-like isoform X1 [Rhopalosiphum padi]|uniref:caprin-2-like isoform X1 n=1 Tax=Rhopalosiphum padi TaxID=40932 RepID=UPI00298DAA66|nr:caprin-2-like isoform X1 [Rhopalosiphum padi]